MTDPKRIVILGASGLIGQAIAADLSVRGLSVMAVARRFTPAQRHAFRPDAREMPLAECDAPKLARLLDEYAADVVVNCLGTLQDRPGESVRAVHDGFAQRLIAALRAAARPALLAHISIPGGKDGDRTDFSRSKRDAERLIRASGLPYVILRPGFVWAPSAYGGSALMRALAALPAGLPAFEGNRPFSVVAVEDIAETIAVLAQRWRPEKPQQAAVWDVMHPERTTIAGVLNALRDWLGTAPRVFVTMPEVLLDLGARAGDLVSRLGWAPPIRSTALAELRRGVTGDPKAWMAATGIAPRSLAAVLKQRPATLQDKWFARLFLLKSLVIAILVAFWCVSGLIALTIAYKPAVAILTAHGQSETFAHAATNFSSLMDISIGIAIAIRRVCGIGLIAGILASLFYMIASAFMTPDLWVEPLGALVKTGPAIVLMLVALATLDNR